MSDRRTHRGAHPGDEELFMESEWPALQQAVHDLSWLLTRGYSEPGAIKLVGDHYGLRARQRLAVQRSSCSDQALQNRRAKQIGLSELGGKRVVIDAFNLLLTIEAALGGGILIEGRDGCCRDMSSIHGSYRKVEETKPALTLIGEALADAAIKGACWYLDRPVSNSGRLSKVILELAEMHQWPWVSEVIYEVDQTLSQSNDVVVSADSVILDLCAVWSNLASTIVRDQIPGQAMVRMSGM